MYGGNIGMGIGDNNMNNMNICMRMGENNINSNIGRGGSNMNMGNRNMNMGSSGGNQAPLILYKHTKTS